MAIAISRSLRIGDDPEPRLHKTEFYAIMRAAGLGSQPYTLRAEWARFTGSAYCYTMANPQKDIAVLDGVRIASLTAEGGIYTHTDPVKEAYLMQEAGE